MDTIEFETVLRGEATLALPPEVVAQLPKSGVATVVFLLPDDREDQDWRKTAYEQFMRDDNSEDAVYDKYQ